DARQGPAGDPGFRGHGAEDLALARRRGEAPGCPVVGEEHECVTTLAAATSGRRSRSPGIGADANLRISNPKDSTIPHALPVPRRLDRTVARRRLSAFSWRSG